VRQQTKKAKLDLSVGAGTTRVGKSSVAEERPQANVLGQTPNEQDSRESNAPLVVCSFIFGGNKIQSPTALRGKQHFIKSGARLGPAELRAGISLQAEGG